MPKCYKKLIDRQVYYFCFGVSIFKPDASFCFVVNFQELLNGSLLSRFSFMISNLLAAKSCTSLYLKYMEKLI